MLIYIKNILQSYFENSSGQFLW